jgi:hypothetical protein
MSEKKQWTCSRCNVTSSWMEGASGGGQPETWSEQDGELYCLVCRRAVAAEAVIDAAPEESDSASRAQARRRALLEFEIRRTPDRANSKIAAACRTSVPAVAKARQRIGIPAAPYAAPKSPRS